MTYDANDDGDAVVPGSNRRDYLRLREFIGDREAAAQDDMRQSDQNRAIILRWAMAVSLVIVLGFLAAVFVLWVGPLFMDKELIPWMDWQMQAFSKPMLAVMLFASVAIFPVFLIPSSPSMWVAGMAFGYGIGFLIIFCGVSIGVSLPFFVGSLFYSKIEGWLEKCPTKRVSLIRMAGEGDWLSQFQAVILIRISPFPYLIYNYCAIATNVNYTPYLLGSLVGVVPEIFAAIYTGILIRSLADASQGRHSMSTSEIVFNVLGFCGTVVTTVVVTVYVKSRLKTFQEEEEQLLLK